MPPRTRGGESARKQQKLGDTVSKPPPEIPKQTGQTTLEDNPKKDDPKNQEDEPMPAAAGADAVKLEPARDGEEEAASGADLVKAGSGSAESQDAASGADLVKAGSGSAGSQDAASGAAHPVIKVEPAATEEVMGWSLAQVLEMDSLAHQAEFIRRWSINIKKRVDSALLQFLRQHKECANLNMDIPTDVMAISPLAISGKNVGEALSAFREVMDYDNLHAAFRGTGQYEAAGTIWMLDPCGNLNSDGGDGVTFAQIDAALGQWSEANFVRSHSNPDMRRYSFDIPLPARVEKSEMAQRKDAESMGVLMSAPLPMIATDGREVIFMFQVDRPTVTIYLADHAPSFDSTHSFRIISPSTHPSTHAPIASDHPSINRSIVPSITDHASIHRCIHPSIHAFKICPSQPTHRLQFRSFQRRSRWLTFT